MGRCYSRYGEEEAAWRREVKAGDEVMVASSWPSYTSLYLAVAKRVTATLVIVEANANGAENKYARDTGLLRGSTGNYRYQYIVRPTEERKVESARLKAVYRLNNCKWDDQPVEVVLRIAGILEEESTK